jgi:hypothetical protein
MSDDMAITRRARPRGFGNAGDTPAPTQPSAAGPQSRTSKPRARETPPAAAGPAKPPARQRSRMINLRLQPDTEHRLNSLLAQLRADAVTRTEAIHALIETTDADELLAAVRQRRTRT